MKKLGENKAIPVVVALSAFVLLGTALFGVFTSATGLQYIRVTTIFYWVSLISVALAGLLKKKILVYVYLAYRLFYLFNLGIIQGRLFELFSDLQRVKELGLSDKAHVNVVLSIATFFMSLIIYLLITYLYAPIKKKGTSLIMVVVLLSVINYICTYGMDIAKNTMLSNLQGVALCLLNASLALESIQLKDISSKTVTRNNVIERSMGQENVIKEIKELKALLDEGIITDEEFEAKKKKLLGS